MSEELLERLGARERLADRSRQELRQLAELVRRMQDVPLFSSLDESEVVEIALAGEIKRYERGVTIIREGDTDKVFYVLLKGQVRAWTKNDPQGPRLLNYHSAGDFFGELALLNGDSRGANIDVVEDAILIAFERDGFNLIDQHGPISRYLQTWGRERIRRSNQPFPGKHWDEISVVQARKSWVALARMVTIPVAIILFTLALVGTLFLTADLSGNSRNLLLGGGVAILVGMVLWSIWMWEDWRNDVFIVTSKRIIQIERILVPPFPTERHEAAIGQVLDITTRNHGLLTWLFRVHSLEIKTAGAGTISFPYLQDADQISQEIFQARDLSLVRRQIEEQSRIREALFKELDKPVQEFQSLESGEVPEITPRHTGLLRFLDYIVPRTRVVEPNQIVWRKHWLILLREAGLPVIGMLFSMALFALAILRPDFLRSIPSLVTMLVPALVLLASTAVYIWRYDGWRNDKYIVTDNRIIDVESSPFHLRKETRTEGTFDIIQNTDYNSPGLLARILRIGDVTIDTASKQQAFTFTSVERPEEVQQEIFKRVMAFRERRAREEAERRYAELARWFDTYHNQVVELKE